MQEPSALEVSPPVAGPRGYVGDPFGWRTRPHGPDLHTGIDIGGPPGWPVLAVLPGVVRAVHSTGELDRYGNVIVLEHARALDGARLFSLYAHMQARPSLVVGQAVNAGQLIGAIGDTAGRSSRAGRVRDDARTVGPHLHFEMLTRWPARGLDLDRIDPALVLGPLGLVLRRHSRIEIVRGSPADRTAHELTRVNGYATRSSPSPSSSQSSGAGPLLLLWLLFGGG